jgi:hypothetical protein
MGISLPVKRQIGHGFLSHSLWSKGISTAQGTSICQHGDLSWSKALGAWWLERNIMNSPVLFLVFNRPETTWQVFEAIRTAKPPRLYIAADGPRLEREGERTRCEEVRKIALKVDWECDVRTLFCDENLGCKIAPSGGISWFFEHEDEGIILEDDCLPDQSFFSFCKDLLERYRHDTRIMVISGDNFQQGRKRTEYSYYFSRLPHCWGWATWKRAWELYDGELSAWPEIQKNRFLYDIANGYEPFVAYWSYIFDKCYAGEIDTWDYQWVLSCWGQSGLTVLPNINLVTNIGFGNNATHTTYKNAKEANIPAYKIEFPLNHPPYIIRDMVADQYTEMTCYNNFTLTPPLQYRLRYFIKKIYRKIAGCSLSFKKKP